MAYAGTGRIMTTRPVMLIDTREQRPLAFGPDVDTERVTLCTGDYSVTGCTDIARVERKSLPDLVACVGRDRERFENELRRLDAFPVRALVIEATPLDAEAPVLARVLATPPPTEIRPMPQPDPLLEFPVFANEVRARLESGRIEYGDLSFVRPLPELLHEVLEELYDVAAWSFIAARRLRAPEALATAADPPKPMGVHPSSGENQ